MHHPTAIGLPWVYSSRHNNKFPFGYRNFTIKTCYSQQRNIHSSHTLAQPLLIQYVPLTLNQSTNRLFQVFTQMTVVKRHTVT